MSRTFNFTLIFAIRQEVDDIAIRRKMVYGVSQVLESFRELVMTRRCWQMVVLLVCWAFFPTLSQGFHGDLLPNDIPFLSKYGAPLA